jgi:chromate transporter
MLNANKKSVTEVFRYFLRLGFLGFGGPLAIVGSIQKDLIEERQWIAKDEFLRTFALIKAMPGPVAFQTSVYVGQRRAGFPGAVAAAFGLIGPSFLMMIALGVFHDRLQSIPAAQVFLIGVQATALGVIVASLKGLIWSYRKSWEFWSIAVFAGLFTWAHPALEPLVIVSMGAMTAALSSLKRNRTLVSWLGPVSLCGVGSMALTKSPDIFSAWQSLAWSCFKAGAFVFGSGLAIVPLMENDFVTRLGWLTHSEFMDALAFGQITPGPVVMTATFIGYKSLGLLGAMTATVAIFGASFFHMTTWFPRVNEKMSRLSWINAFLTGAIGAVVGAILAAAIRLSMPLLNDKTAIVLIAVSILTVLFTKIPAWLVIPLGGLVTLAVSSL